MANIEFVFLFKELKLLISMVKMEEESREIVTKSLKNTLFDIGIYILFGIFSQFVLFGCKKFSC
jgi:hypothetical protein